jgi:hypothetical protein
MPSNRSKIITLTDYISGGVFQVSSCQIISFQAIGLNDTSITYINQRGVRKVGQRVTQTPAAIATACISNAIGILTPITLDTGIILYINIDRIIYIDVLSNSAPVITAVTYDALINPPQVYLCSAPTALALSNLTDNMLAITTVATSSIPSRTRYINNLKIDILTGTTSSHIFYDEHKTEFIKLEATQTVAAIIATVNAL